MFASAAHGLAEGILTWMPEERVLGRFGSVSLLIDGHQYVIFRNLPLGVQARLSVTVLRVRHTVLPPDPARGLQPSTPYAGDRIELGTGIVFAPDLSGVTEPIAVGIAPAPSQWRAHRWLSPTALYRAHNHLVRLELWPCLDFTDNHTASAA